jgi:hypothetical protein
MANPPPLPPIVSGPVYTTSKQVLVNSVLPHAKVTVYNDAASTHVVGTATSTGPGSIWVPLTGPIAHGQPITASQKYTGSDPKIQVTGESPPSTLPVPVLAPPTPLPAPIFASGLCTCMDWVYIDGLIAGASLTIKMGATTMVSAAIVTQTPQWFQLASHPIPAGSVLQATQNIGASVSPTTPSAAIWPAPPLVAPVIAPTPLDCETSMNISNVQPGADLIIKNGTTNVYSATNPSSSYNLYDLSPPLLPGPSSVEQYFPRCKEQRPVTVPFTVKKKAPPAPTVTYNPCADVNILTVSDFDPGEVMTIEVAYSTTAGPKKHSLGSSGVSPSGQLGLPKNWYPSAAVGPVTLVIQGLLCDLTSPSTSVPVTHAPGPHAAPTLQRPLYDCATSVFVRGANPGCLIQVFAKGSPPTPRSNPTVATTANFPVSLSSPLGIGEQIFVQQLGCGASVTPAAAVKVVAPPTLPLPAVAGSYVLTTATSVLVNNVVPGAQVQLFVNRHARNAPVDSIQAETGPPKGTPPRIQVSVPVGWPPLAAGDVLTAGQTLCKVNKFPTDKGGVKAQTPLAAPSPGPGEPRGGLGSNNNYFMFTPLAGGGCANLLKVSVTLTVQKAIVWTSTGPSTPPGKFAPPGFSLQVNCYSLIPSSPPANYPAIQQYIIDLWGTQLSGAVNTWAITPITPSNPSGTKAIILPSGNEYTTFLGSALPSTVIPAGYTLTINLGNDSSGNVNSISWVVNGAQYPPTPLSLPNLLTSNGLLATDIAPIVGFTVGLVGPVNSESAVISSGSGTITYSASTPLTVSNVEPLACGSVSTNFTAETATTSYGVLPANPGNPFSQSFAASATTPLIRRMGALRLVRRR